MVRSTRQKDLPEIILDLSGISLVPGKDTVPLEVITYTSELLDERKVVRLVRTPLIPVEDLSLDILGLKPTEYSAVGFVRSRAVGFPAWPIINDPKNAKHALNLVHDLQRVARQAKSKPGAAKDTLVELASKLGTSAPHFLPTFLEEAARIYLALDNKTHATRFFGMAREAERVHNLAIDEARNQAVFIEFALAGPLVLKS